MSDIVRVSEIFSSLQGEGLYQGQRHLFVRFHGCSFSCLGCDEINKPYSEVSLDDLCQNVLEADKSLGPHNFISITGGEPLEQSEMLKLLCQSLKSNNKEVILETNGVLATEFQKVSNWVDVVSLDYKLSSVWKTDDVLDNQKLFLECLHNHKFYVKVVISMSADINEFLAYLKCLNKVNRSVTLILHPHVTDNSANMSDITEVLLNFQSVALEYIHDVRVLPRIHNIFNLR